MRRAIVAPPGATTPTAARRPDNAPDVAAPHTRRTEARTATCAAGPFVVPHPQAQPRRDLVSFADLAAFAANVAVWLHVVTLFH